MSAIREYLPLLLGVILGNVLCNLFERWLGRRRMTRWRKAIEQSDARHLSRDERAVDLTLSSDQLWGIRAVLELGLERADDVSLDPRDKAAAWLFCARIEELAAQETQAAD